MKSGVIKKSLGRQPLLYPQPILLIGTYGADKRPNVMTAAWAGISSSDPLTVSVALRPARLTLEFIEQTKAFTISIPSRSMVESVDYVGMVSGRRADKFPTAGFTPVQAEYVNAPYVAECPIVMECTLYKTMDLHSHTLLIATVEDVKADEACLDADGKPDILKVDPLVYDAGTSAYYGVGKKTADAFSAGKGLIKNK